MLFRTTGNRLFVTRLTAVICLALGATLIAAPAKGAIEVDGNVLGFGEGYSLGYNVNFTIEHGNMDPDTVEAGGKLFTHDDGTRFFFGLTVPLTLDDNTWGANVSQGWIAAGKAHELLGSGGVSLEGSDKWKIKYTSPSEGAIEIEVDYVKNDGSGVYTVPINKFKVAVNIDPSGNITADTSVAYNLTEIIDASMLSPVDLAELEANSPDPQPAGWVNEIQYEFSVLKSVVGNNFITELLANLGELHLSPNMLGKNKVIPMIGTPLTPPGPGPGPGPNPIPEPNSLLIWGMIVAGAGVFGWRRRRC